MVLFVFATDCLFEGPERDFRDRAEEHLRCNKVPSDYIAYVRPSALRKEREALHSLVVTWIEFETNLQRTMTE